MELTAFWDLVRSALGLDQLLAAEALAKTIQVLIIVLITVWIAQWVSRSILNASFYLWCGANGRRLSNLLKT